MATVETIEAKVVGLDKDIKSLEYRMTKVEEISTTVNSLATSIQVLATNMQQMAKEQQRLADIQQNAESRIRTLELEPADVMRNVKKTIIGCVVSAMGGAIVGAIISIL